VKRRPLLPFAFCLLLFAFLVSCGYVGAPLPPALNIPRKISDLRVIQRAEQVVVEFTIPSFTTEALPLKLKRIELQAGVWRSTPFNTELWAAQARVLEPACNEPGLCRTELPVRDWVGQEAFFRVRAVSHSSRPGEWSDFGILPVVAPLDPPAAVRAEAVRDGVKISWQALRDREGATYRVRRRSRDEEAPQAVASVPETQWIDPGTEYGARYEYSVQSAIKTGPSEAESEWSELAIITPEDRFPPSVPAGLTALAGVASAELAWDRNTEPDFRGYRVYRAEGGAFQPAAKLVETPSYSDPTVESGKTYRYAVSAIDQLGNESEMSSPVEIAIP